MHFDPASLSQPTPHSELEPLRPAPGKVSTTQRLTSHTNTSPAAPVRSAPASTPIQRKQLAHDLVAALGFVGGPAPDVEQSTLQLATDVHTGLSDEELTRHAAAGISGSGGPLPHLEAIQRAFGPAHDLSGVRAHIGGAAADSARAIGAHAYASGNHLAFAAQPDLFLAAHEAAHVVQQRKGVSLKGAVGQADDAYERHADEVAAAVVRGDSAAELLDGGTAAVAEPAIQRKDSGKSKSGKKKKAAKPNQALQEQIAARHAKERAAFEEYWADPAPPTIADYMGQWVRPKASGESLSIQAVAADEAAIEAGEDPQIQWSSGHKVHPGMKGKVIAGYSSAFGDLVQVAMAGSQKLEWFVITEVTADVAPSEKDTSSSLSAKETKKVEAMVGGDGAFSPEMMSNGGDLLASWLPHKGDAIQLTVRFNFPLFGAGGYGMIEMLLSAERDDQFKVRGELNFGVFGKVDLWLFEAFAQIKAGLFLEASGDSGQECMQLLGLGALSMAQPIIGEDAVAAFFADTISSTRKNMDKDDYVDVGGQVEASAGVGDGEDHGAKAAARGAKYLHITGDKSETQTEYKLGLEVKRGNWVLGVELGKKGSEGWKLVGSATSELEMADLLDSTKNTAAMVAILAGLADAFSTIVSMDGQKRVDAATVKSLQRMITSATNLEFGLGALAASKLGIGATAAVKAEIEITGSGLSISLFRVSKYEVGQEMDAGAYVAYEDKERIGKWTLGG